MSARFRLEDFTAGSDAIEAALTQADLDTAKSEAYERGYASGWEDSVAAADADNARIDAEFARNLADLGFTFQEARAHVTAQVQPVLEELIATVFPMFAAEGLAQAILTEIDGRVDDAADRPVRVRVAPKNAEIVRRMGERAHGLPMEVVEEPALAEGQAFLDLGETERHVDLSGVIDALREAVAALSRSNERILNHD